MNSHTQTAINSQNSSKFLKLTNNNGYTSINWVPSNYPNISSVTNNNTSTSLTIGDTTITDGKLIFNDREIDLKHIITASDLENKATFEDVYKVLFMKLCAFYKENEDEYNALLRIYNFNYRNTVLSIEIDRMKASIKAMTKTMEDNND